MSAVISMKSVGERHVIDIEVNGNYGDPRELSSLMGDGI